MDRMLKFFAYDHLPEHLKAVSRPFHDLALHIAVTVPAGPERTVALRKLLESKDAAVRAVAIPEIADRPPPPRPEPSSPIRKG
jgi:hypothetical protein